MTNKEIKKLRQWSELDYKAKELEERLAPYQVAELEMEKHLKERIKVLQEALEYLIKLKNN